MHPDPAFPDTTQFLDEEFHADGRDESVSPPLLSAAVRFAMLQKFLALEAGDAVLDLGCGSGRFSVWMSQSGAYVVGVDVGTYFAVEARLTVDQVVGDLRRLPLADASFTKACAVDVFEHLSPDNLLLALREAARVLGPGGALFVYTHLRQRSPFAPVLDLLRRVALGLERLGLSDLTLERLRPTDHVNPLEDYDHLRKVAAQAGFRVARLRYYTPILARLAESILVPVAAHLLARAGALHWSGGGSGPAAGVDAASRRAARLGVKQRIARRGPVYWVLRALTAAVMLDVVLLGRVPSGPFFALLVKHE